MSSFPTHVAHSNRNLNVPDGLFNTHEKSIHVRVRNRFGVIIGLFETTKCILNPTLFDLVENHGEGGGIDWEGKAQRLEFASLEVDHGLIEIMGLPIIEGRLFSPNFSSDSSAVIFNETAIRAMGLEDPIGKTVKRWGKQVHIIGIVKDFHFESLYEKVMPFFFSYSNKGDNVIIKYNLEWKGKLLPK